MAENFSIQWSEQEFTGRSLVLFKEHPGETEADASSRMQALLQNRAGVHSYASTLDTSVQSFQPEQFDGVEAAGLAELGMAIISDDQDRAASLASVASDPDSEIEAVIPERYDFLTSEDFAAELDTAESADEEQLLQLNPARVRRLGLVLRMLLQLSDALAPDAVEEATALATGACFRDTDATTWGLQATGVVGSKYSGRGVRVAVLDTGIDLNHRDFRRRHILAHSVVPNVSADDRNGHGMHCIGTACGPKISAFGPRYGIAYDSEIVALKVFNNAPRPAARRGDVITAMGLAVRAGCKIISLSLGSRTNGSIEREYEDAISRVRAHGTLVIAAAGNDSGPGTLVRTGAPGNSPSAMAVAAIDQCLRRANFSNVDLLEIAGPGVGVLSSIPGNQTRRLNGTSMATPHVAGIAALWLEANPGWGPDELQRGLQRSVRRLPQPISLVGTGLVQAP